MNISTLQSNLEFIKSLYFNKEWKDDYCKNGILEAIKECNTKIERAFGISMHSLEDHTPSIKAVEKVVQKFPSTLTRQIYGTLPIHRAADLSHDIARPEYVTTLAKEGVKHNIGGEHGRGGLLTVDGSDRDRWNTLQKLSRCQNVNAFEELRKIGLLKKNDIREQALLVPSIIYNTESDSETFEYFINWDPDALVNTMYDRHPLVQAICRFENSDSDCKEKAFSIALKAGFKYHSEIGGLLFIKDEWDVKAFDFAYNEFGIMKVMYILQRILSPDCNYPILHHICIKAPRHKDLFMMKFPWAYQLRDSQGRSLHQAILAAGPDVMNSNDILLATLTDSQIQTKDPITTLYPFAAMAVGEHADLENCFYLLRRQPSVLDKRSRANSESGRRRRRKKRKMNDTVIDEDA